MIRSIMCVLVALSTPLTRDPCPVLEDFLVLPVRVHVLSSAELPELDCKLSDEDVRRILGKVNAIWRSEGIFWGLESIVREPAAHQDRFRAHRDLSPGGLAPLVAYKGLMPSSTRLRDGLDVYYLHRFSVNGVYLGDRVAFVQETARLREVPGGMDEPLPRVTAHELGHALGLPHRQDRTNLLASGTTGTELNEQEGTIARLAAEELPGRLSFVTLRNRAETEGDLARRALYEGWLRELRSAGSRAMDRPARGPGRERD